jgi:CheY-like chemotaxis protein
MTHNETILLVEDNDNLRQLLCEQLIGAGFSVREAKDTDTALRVYHQDPALDLLLTDFRLEEKKTGVELALELRQFRPDLPVLILTGYPTEADAASNGAFRILAKPLSQKRLVEEILSSIAGTPVT